MHLNCQLELTLKLDTEKLDKLLKKLKARGDYHRDQDKEMYVDKIWESKGITVTFLNTQYQKKIKLTIIPDVMQDNALEPGNTSTFVSKLERYVEAYFNSKYKLNNFRLSLMNLTTQIDVRNRERASDYLKVLKRIGRVKGFSPTSLKRFDNEYCFGLEGNSNGIDFLICDLGGFVREQMKESESKRKELKTIADKSEGLLRVEIRLTKPKAIRDNTDEAFTTGQIAQLLRRSQKIFLKTFEHIVPFGDFYKKDKADEIVWSKVSNEKMRRRMLRLLELLPEKKSLLLAQKAMDSRKIDNIMEEFADIELSPITISKRHDIKKLNNIYKYI